MSSAVREALEGNDYKHGNNYMIEQIKEEIDTNRFAKGTTRVQIDIEAIVSNVSEQENAFESIDISRGFTPEEFNDRFQQTKVPCVIHGATEAWKTDSLLEDLETRFGDFLFRVGTSTASGKPVKLALSTFLEYARTSDDYNPLYLFHHLGSVDGSLAAEDTCTKSILGMFSPPSVIPVDLFSCIPQQQRQPYRWLIVGTRGY